MGMVDVAVLEAVAVHEAGRVEGANRDPTT